LLNPDFRDMLFALSAAGAEYLVVGAYALAAHGLPRATGDLDIWIRRTSDNARRVWQAMERFGAPRSRLSIEDLAVPDTVFQIGVAPRRIDILTSVDAVEFDEAWPQRKMIELEGHAVPVIGRDHLIQNKRACGRPKDLADVAWLLQASEP
jgi:hypothetical protein